MTSSVTVSRRTFLRLGLVIGAGFAIGAKRKRSGFSRAFDDGGFH